MKYKIWYWYMFGKALYTRYGKSSFTLAEAMSIRNNELKGYRHVKIVEDK